MSNDSSPRATPPRGRVSPWALDVGPDPASWDDWMELDSAAWPEKRERHYRCVPTICFNCESGCGLLAFVDKETDAIQKFEGNPVHPGSRGRTCAKGPATINQVNDTERILRPLKRVGKRGAGTFEPVSWDEALDDIAGRVRRALDEDRHDEIMYHVGRPGEDHFMPRLISAWGIDGFNSHTNVCSASARTGFALWCGSDRPSPDYANAKFILLISAHLETGHYFNPHAQRIVEAKEAGARMAVVDTRLSNTASRADHWVSTWPGSEAALLLGVAYELIRTRRIDQAFLKTWTNWTAWMEARAPEHDVTFDAFLTSLEETYASYTPEFVAQECRVDPSIVSTLADEIHQAGTRFASHLWRSAASGNLGGWQIARALTLLHVLTGSFGVEGGLNPNSWDKFVPKPTNNPTPIDRWNELIWPKEFPLAHYEMSFLLPHLLRAQDKKLDVYFTRVYNPVWTNPDGCSWIDMLENESRVGCHVALTPIWSESAQWADYVLPMGLAPERHDVMSQETHAGTWIGFRQPVLREHARLNGRETDSTRETNPGEVWEEAEFWIALTHKIDPDGSRGMAKYFESPDKPGSPMSMDEYFGDLFGNVPGLSEAASAEGMTPLEYMRRRGAFAVPYAGQARYAQPDDQGNPAGFPTPSKKLEIYSPTLAAWGHADEAVPGYIRSHVHWRHLNQAKGERVLLPTFRLPTLIHTRSGNAKWLQEISHTNPLWVHPKDAEALGLTNGGLVRVSTDIGYFIPRVWVTEGIHPGIVACSHHVGRWRLHPSIGGQQAASSLVDMTRTGDTYLLRQKRGAKGPKGDRDADHVWWHEVGVNQNLTFPVQPDPVSGMHCWHQRVTVTPPQGDDRYGDISVDLAKSRAIYDAWIGKTVPAPGPGGLRRPLWLKRTLHPQASAYQMNSPM